MTCIIVLFIVLHSQKVTLNKPQLKRFEDRAYTLGLLSVSSLRCSCCEFVLGSLVSCQYMNKLRCDIV